MCVVNNPSPAMVHQTPTDAWRVSSTLVCGGLCIEVWYTVRWPDDPVHVLEPRSGHCHEGCLPPLSLETIFISSWPAFPTGTSHCENVQCDWLPMFSLSASIYLVLSVGVDSWP
ncbi:hypothetical protein CEXT_459321 [Caerostris extrusa]|uniref:Uncharacterized protein n=1 Tax=Caerostris extrusa TaxID=172846 RepID=A0AAV4Q7P0_CAEEX|nr:hypothetical protein CEXT_459321 [Caerostris extrusa]